MSAGNSARSKGALVLKTKTIPHILRVLLILKETNTELNKKKKKKKGKKKEKEECIFTRQI